VWLMRDNDPQHAFGAPIFTRTAGGPEPTGGSRFFAICRPVLIALQYRATVYGYKDKVRLVAGMQTFLEIQWGPSWPEGVAGGDTFYVRTLLPELGQAYLHSMRYLGPAQAPS
jgi:hypothetical protein